MRKFFNDLKSFDLNLTLKNEQITKFFKITLKVWSLSLIFKTTNFLVKNNSNLLTLHSSCTCPHFISFFFYRIWALSFDIKFVGVQLQRFMYRIFGLFYVVILPYFVYYIKVFSLIFDFISLFCEDLPKVYL